MAPKRKVAEVSQNSAEMTKKSTKKVKLSTDEIIAQIRLLESQVHESKTNSNNIITLIDYITPNNADIVVLTASQALRRIFVVASKNNEFSYTNTQDIVDAMSESRKKYNKWMNTQLKKYITAILPFIGQSFKNGVSDGLVLASIDALMDIALNVYSSSDDFNDTKHTNILVNVIIALSAEENRSEIYLKHFYSHWLHNYDDIRYGVLKHITQLSSMNLTSFPYVTFPLESTAITLNLINVLAMMKKSYISSSMYYKAEKKKTKEHLFKSPLHMNTKLPRGLSDAWKSVLSSKMSPLCYKRALEITETIIIPDVSDPLSLADFLTDAFNSGGIVSILALSGLFILMTKYNMNYPHFLEKLYSLCDGAYFASRHRLILFKLLAKVLNGSYLPSYMVSAYVKKLARIALYSPPNTSVFILALLFNLIRKHPSLASMVNRNAVVKRGLVINSATMPLEDISAKTAEIADRIINGVFEVEEEGYDETKNIEFETVDAEEETVEEEEAVEEEEVKEEDNVEIDAVEAAPSLFDLLTPAANNTQSNTSVGLFSFSSIKPSGKTAPVQPKKNKSTMASLPALAVDATNIEVKVDANAWVNGKDPFCAYVKEPADACAIESSLIEIASLCNHYCPDVSRLAKLFFAESAPKTGHHLDEYINLTFDSLFTSATEFRKNRHAAMEYEKPKSLFGRSEDSKKTLQDSIDAEKEMLLDDMGTDDDDDDDEDVKEMRAIMKAAGQVALDVTETSEKEVGTTSTITESIFSL